MHGIDRPLRSRGAAAGRGPAAKLMNRAAQTEKNMGGRMDNPLYTIHRRALLAESMLRAEDRKALEATVASLAGLPETDWPSKGGMRLSLPEPTFLFDLGPSLRVFSDPSPTAGRRCWISPVRRRSTCSAPSTRLKNRRCPSRPAPRRHIPSTLLSARTITDENAGIFLHRPGRLPQGSGRTPAMAGSEPDPRREATDPAFLPRTLIWRHLSHRMAGTSTDTTGSPSNTRCSAISRATSSSATPPGIPTA